MQSPAGQTPVVPNARGRAAGLLREEGPLALGTRLLRRVVHSLVDMGSVTFFEKDLSAEVAASPSAGVSARQLRACDRESLLYGTESPWEELMARFGAGDLCFGAVDQCGRALHTRWLTFAGARIPELGLDFVPTPDAAYFYDGYTRPDARRRGIDAVVRQAIFEVLRERGRRRVYSYVRDDNPGGLRAAGRHQRAVGVVRSVRLLGSGPFVVGRVAAPLSTLLWRRSGPGRTAATREAEWRAWFEGWLEHPLARRSIGFHDLPPAHLEAIAEHVASTLGLEPSSDLVLDVGCDSAMVSRYVAPRCAALVGVDFIPRMLVDARSREGELPGNLWCAAADGRRLPFPARTFAKAYCSGVIHTLPTREDGVALILELARVSKPGGLVLVAAVPDSRKRWRARREAFRLGDLRQRVGIALVVALPERVRRLARRLVPWLPRAPLRYLEYDLSEVGAQLESRGLACETLDYPPDFRSRDFRETRSSLLISIPPPPHAEG